MRALSLKILIASLLLIGISCEGMLLNSNQDLSGEWQCKEIHEIDGTRTYYVDIEYANQDSSQIRIYNFLYLDNTSLTSSRYVYASVSGLSLTIPRQQIEDHTVEGNGTINNSYTSINLQFTDDLNGGDPWDVSATLTK
ncbi:MAG: hypothetical protein PF481_10205 [Bacteroidales bacterium]|jgi:hypothetical protein|nr:hypothetical protein [Bacteroidales bacterium]